MFYFCGSRIDFKSRKFQLKQTSFQTHLSFTKMRYLKIWKWHWVCQHKTLEQNRASNLGLVDSCSYFLIQPCGMCGCIITSQSTYFLFMRVRDPGEYLAAIVVFLYCFVQWLSFGKFEEYFADRRLRQASY
ncbi:hypothetical protein METBIDRAFT_110556 [Metschnikowia bicuspidata var. bicuspidata NRRL YB-4993]|uniref:Uncharacterized protein n=1 Tax=Metschnikowia bicuspidata var. bicuspidata NRRL YB-4993 TaxID=869754 RepID=A0A1A0HI60_9ASCO|nr:hypothetical protein METBIDRAFT_110556 [Metschnikowia bicuspidata var. bicuspidata NRRL YB-4993]OBA23686.1 hypothetical protein METBIDRAFT_110556 [Metschnikowia bicuspidata var. bicuspidata NRRL YB-4993]